MRKKTIEIQVKTYDELKDALVEIMSERDKLLELNQKLKKENEWLERSLKREIENRNTLEGRLEAIRKAHVDFINWLSKVEWRGVSSEVYDEFKQRFESLVEVSSTEEKSVLSAPETPEKKAKL